MTYPIAKTDAEWRAQLDATQFAVTRQSATERAFTGKYWNHWADGTYRCVEIEQGRIERVVDHSHGMVRVEVRCQQCGAHLGHVFDDGPEPSGERYCINSASIDFRPDTP